MEPVITALSTAMLEAVNSSTPGSESRPHDWRPWQEHRVRIFTPAPRWQRGNPLKSPVAWEQGSRANETRELTVEPEDDQQA
jgi:hypothetical protein